MQVEGSSPKPPQRFRPEAFLGWISKQKAAGYQIVCCYEAGPLGFTLHRQLVAQGAINYVIRPRDWDDNRKGIKTDRTDALSILQALDRFVAGNPKALALVRVPTVQEERRRSQTRLREGLLNQMKSLAQRGRGLALQYGFRLKGQWYGPARWLQWKAELPAWLQNLLEPLRQSVLFVRRQVQELSQQIEQAAPEKLPKGMGSLSYEVIEREICDWSRFKNRRQLGSLTGLVPRKNSSGPRRYQGTVSKVGNPRLRWVLCELAWRLLRYQPNYRLVKKWRPRMLDRRLSGGRRKQMIIALARGFIV